MKYLRLLLILCLVQFGLAQEYETLPPDYIKTIEFTNVSDLTGTPIVRMGQPMKLTFDDTRALVEDFYYTIEHFNYDWTPSKLAKNEYLEGFDNPYPNHI